MIVVMAEKVVDQQYFGCLAGLGDLFAASQKTQSSEGAVLEKTKNKTTETQQTSPPTKTPKQTTPP